MNRRDFTRRTAAGLAGLTVLGPGGDAFGRRPSRPTSSRNPIRIRRVSSDFEREPLIRPFGFKGGFLTEIWQSVAFMESDSGRHGIGLGTQSVLWSDADVFAAHSESGGNSLMFNLTERALRMVEGTSFETPIELLDDVLDEIYEYGKQITGNPNLRKTFALNALVPFDNAAWLLYAQENDIDDFDALIPERYRPGLSYRHDRVAAIPTVAFTIPVQEIVDHVDDGHFFLKIKLGHPGTQEEMLEKDKAHLENIHEALKDRRTEYTESGKLPYYFDANGRYESKETLLRLLDHARTIGAFEQIAVVEEPFPEHLPIEVGEIGVPIAADESAHTDADALERIEMGYSAIALKAVAKTLSMTMKIAQLAHEHDVPCFCADLTVNPILVDWNKMVAARLAPFPGFDVGLLETNGHQNYANWEEMEAYHPCTDASWRQVVDGVFPVGDDFYDRGGCIFERSAHYERMFAALTE